MANKKKYGTPVKLRQPVYDEINTISKTTGIPRARIIELSLIAYKDSLDYARAMLFNNVNK